MSDSTFRHTWPDRSADFVLERARDGDEPEIIGRIIEHRRSQTAETAEGWSWSLTSCARPVGIRRPTFATDGFEQTRQGAADALRAAWEKESAWRAEVVAAGLPEGMGPEMRAHFTTGQPTPPKWNRDLPEDQ